MRGRAVRRWIWGLATALVATLAPIVPTAGPARAVAAHPRLLFNAADVVALRSRITSGTPAAMWARLSSRVDAYVTPGHPAYLDPALVMEDLYNGPLGPEGHQVYAASLRPYDGLFGQNQMSTGLIELGLAWQLSQKVKYADRAIALLQALATKNWPAWACPTNTTPAQEIWCDLGMGDLMAGVGLAFDMVYDRMTPAVRTQIVTSLAAHKSEVFGIVFHPGTAAETQSNWAGVSSGGAGLAMLAIDGEVGAPADLGTYIAQAHGRVGGFLQNAFGVNGDPKEGYVYGGYGLKNAVPYAIAARRNGQTDVLTGSNATRLARWAAYDRLPGMGHITIPQNDSGGVAGSPGVLALEYAMAPTDGIVQWVWQRTAGPQGDDFYNRIDTKVWPGNFDCATQYAITTAVYCPLLDYPEDAYHILWWKTPAELPEVSPSTVGRLARSFPEQGLVETRTSFDDGQNALVSSFSARRDMRGHAQYDMGNFTLYGYGAFLAVDSGYSCAVCGDTNESGYAPGHNVLVIDGNQYTQTPWSFQTTGQTIDGHLDVTSLTWSHADLRYVYGGVSPWADRDHVFVRPTAGRPALLIITDHIKRDTNGHSYRWQLHTDVANLVQDSGPGFTVQAANGAQLVGLTASSAGPLEFRERLHQQKNFAEIHPYHNVLYSDSPVVVAFDHLAVMAATPNGVAAPTLATLGVTGGQAISATSGGGVDIVAARDKGAALVSGATLSSDGTLAKLSVGAGETLLVAGASLSYGGRVYVTVTGGPGTVTMSGGEMAASGPSGATYRVYAPQTITAATVNGAAATFCRDTDPDYVIAPC